MKTHRLQQLGLVFFLSLTSAAGAIRFVNLNNSSPAAPYTTWPTAATNIQDAVDAANNGDQILVTNGVYQTGGRIVIGTGLSNRVVVNKAVLVQSVNGPATTSVQGYRPAGMTNGPAAIRCVYLNAGATFSGFTVANGATLTNISDGYGGGIYCNATNALVTNCVVSGNSAFYQGGGVYQGTLRNCTLSANLSEDSGGGACQATLFDCTLWGNSITHDVGGGGGGGAFGSTLFNCVLSTNVASSSGGGACASTLSNCVLAGNSAYRGGGGESCEFIGCSISNNFASYGAGGAFGGTLSNCVLAANSASEYVGGGAWVATLSYCALTGNSAPYGGGAQDCTLSNCTLAANTATYGAGAYGGAAYYCAFVANAADAYGGGAEGVTLTHCTLTGNSALTGGGADSSYLTHCIVYYNHAPTGSNYWNSGLDFSCTLPLPDSGTSNLTAEPKLASGSHISAASPCRGAGSATASGGLDIDSEPWANPPSIGCDEYYSGTLTGWLSVVIQAPYTNAATGADLELVASIGGKVSASVWNFGDGTIVSNQPYASHHWAAPGDYAVVLRAYNDSFPGGVSATSIVHIAVNPVQFVARAGNSPLPPYTSWATAASNIQDAVDVAFVGGKILVSNGVYQAGSRVAYGVTNRVAVTRPMTIGSVNGSAVTWIDGATGMRCVYLAEGANLSGFALLSGATFGSGGGVSCEGSSSVVSNCTIADNWAGTYGGGAHNGTLVNCTINGNTAALAGGGADNAALLNCSLISNVATNYGGAAWFCTMTDCALVGNTAWYGGGAQESTLLRCTLSNNSVPNSGGAANNCTLTDCVVSYNTASSAGAAAGGMLYRCVLMANVATNDAGAVSSAALTSCAIAGNSAGGYGGGAQNCSLNNCTITGNTAGQTGGGVDASTLENCIVYYNQAHRRDNYSGPTVMNYCCTLPLPGSSMGTGNISADPQLASASHLSAASLCRGAGSAAYALGTDIDGEAWSSPPAIGCDEIHAGSATNAISAILHVSTTNVPVNVPVDFVLEISGRVTSSRWDFGDGTVISNRPYASYAWTAPGDYTVEWRIYNDTIQLGGTTGTVVIHVVPQTIHFVDLSSTNPVAPYNAWSTAATNIQDAVDAAAAGDLVLVTNGIYQTGGQVVAGGVSNRVVVAKPVAVASVNGPSVTIIQGAATNGDAAVRGAYLTNGAALIGFTVTQGGTRNIGEGSYEPAASGGGVWCESSRVVLSNCVLTANSALSGGGGVLGGTLYRCVLTNNSAIGEGGGADYSILYDCTLTGNYGPDWWGSGGGGACVSILSNCVVSGNYTVNYGGGASYSDLYHCSVTGNSGPYAGGAAGSSTLSGCTVSGNSAYGGGAAHLSILDRCIISGNTATTAGGAQYSVIKNSVLSGNTARSTSGAADNCTLNNCTVIGNSAVTAVGGVSSSTLNNCIVYYNLCLVSSNYAGSTLSNCCTQPLPAAGIGNITADPQLADLMHLSAGSACRGAGAAANTTGRDIDGDLWANPPDIGCDQFLGGVVTGSLAVAISAPFTNVTAGLPLSFQAQISGHALASRWEFGDGTIISNRTFISHSWLALGDYPVVLRAYNDSNPGGISATVTVHVVTQPVHYVALSNATPSSPFTSWATAATNIQDAIDAASTVGALVLVSNGVYATGARLVNNDVPHRVVINKRLIVQSVNGPADTIIQGDPDLGTAPVRCVYLGDGASLIGMTLTNGSTLAIWNEPPYEDALGGGVWCETPGSLVTNCTIVACAAGEYGGGAYGGTLRNCTLVNDYAYLGGGGAYLSALDQCVLLTNLCFWYGQATGGGASSSTLKNCVLTGNGSDLGGAVGDSSLTNCTLSANSANAGGAAANCLLVNCAAFGNAARDTGGGAYSSTLYNCTVTANSAGNSAGGVSGCTNFNSLVYYNLAPNGANWVGTNLAYCCTTPLPQSGVVNLATEPLLADYIHLSAGSPCRGAGFAPYAAGLDIDGELWLNPPAIGVDEYHGGSITGALSVAFSADYTTIATGFDINLYAAIGGHASACRWDFGDGTVISNRIQVTHHWNAAGNYPVELRAYNESYPGGVSATNIIYVLVSPVHYVALDNPNPLPPFLSWSTAATNIQDAVNAAYAGGSVIISNGVYQNGGALVNGESNRVAVLKPLSLQSVNGPALTVIDGGGVMRGVYLRAGTAFAGVMVTHGSTGGYGGGIYSESSVIVISNCVLAANSAGAGGGVYNCVLLNSTVTNNSAGAGGGAESCVIYNSLLAANGGGSAGGGADSCTLSNCTLSGNSASGGGGASSSTLNNCIISANNAGTGGGARASFLTNCTLTANSATWSGGADSSTLFRCLVSGNGAGDGGGLGGCNADFCNITGNSASQYGGVDGGTLNNCLITTNHAAPFFGGGAANCTLNNCTIVGNTAMSYGGGVIYYATLNNCIVYYNTAANGANYYAPGGAYVNFDHCCTYPLLATGPGNITNAPGFVAAASGNLRLQTNSPCINSGYNPNAPSSFDLDGNSRIIAGTVDIGAYEFQSAINSAFLAWLQQYGMPTDGSATYADPDGDRMNNWQEWIAGTNPTNALSVLQMITVARNGFGLAVTWQSVSSRVYFLERSTNLAAHPPFSALASNIQGQVGTTTYTDTNATGRGPYFYRVGIQTDAQAQASFSLISFAWLQQYGLPADGSSDFADPDGDHLNNWHEWHAGTNPTNALSSLQMISAVPFGSNTVVTWQSVADRLYFVQRSTNLQSSFATVATNIPGQPGTTSYTDTNMAGRGPFLYRVGVP